MGRQALTIPTFSSTIDQIIPLSSDQVASVRETSRTLGARIMLTMQTLRANKSATLSVPRAYGIEIAYKPPNMKIPMSCTLRSVEICSFNRAGNGNNKINMSVAMLREEQVMSTSSSPMHFPLTFGFQRELIGEHWKTSAADCARL